MGRSYPMYKLSIFLTYFLFTFLCVGQEQVEKSEKFPSYFGFHIKPILPTNYLGGGPSKLEKNEYTATITPYLGYSFGSTVRIGLTELIAFETGINFSQRNFKIDMSVADSSVFAQDSLRFISYDIPLNALVYIKLSPAFYSTVSMGAAYIFKPSEVNTKTYPGGLHEFSNVGGLTRKSAFELNANLGFEYRTKKSGIFYIGGSARVGLNALFTLSTQYKYQGYTNRIYGPVNGSYLAIDFKYLLPNIKNKGIQFKNGPIL